MIAINSSIVNKILEKIIKRFLKKHVDIRPGIAVNEAFIDTIDCDTKKKYAVRITVSGVFTEDEVNSIINKYL